MGKHFDLIFISTFCDLTNIGRLLASSANNNHNIFLGIVLVAQRNLELDIIPFISDCTQVYVVQNDKMLGLSEARNVALQFIFENNLVSDYIMFPDDDSTYDSEFFNHFLTKVTGNTLIDVYATGSHQLFRPLKYQQDDVLSVKQYDAANSVNMIVDFSLVKAVGLFDEKMGVGSAHGAGEDGDYFIRCCKASGKGFRYEKALWNYHPLGDNKYKLMTLDQLINRYKNYGRGVIYMLCKHKLYRSALNCILSAFIGGIIAFVQLDFKLGIARFYAFFTRVSMFTKLIFMHNDYC